MEIHWWSTNNVRAVGTTNLVKLWEEMIPKIDVARTNGLEVKETRIYTNDTN